MEDKIQMDSLEEAASIEGRSNGKDTLSNAVAHLKTTSEDGEYEALIKEMFEKLDRKGKRKVLNKNVLFSATVKKALFKKGW